VQVAFICKLILDATSERFSNRHVLSVDEKTGIQALERLETVGPSSKGGKKRKDYEYIRNGTTCLIAAFELHKGKIVSKLLNKTRTEIDFLKFITNTVEGYPKEDEVVFIADQLNTHMSASLVIYIAKLIGFKGDLGKKGDKGILKNMKTRKAFLVDQKHRVRFAYTPKHCSWLNPIENWFAKLQRHVIKNGNFTSVSQIESKIEKYIEYFNDVLAKPLNWKFRGFNKGKPLENAKGIIT